MIVDLWFWRTDPAAPPDGGRLRNAIGLSEVEPDPARLGGYQGFRLRGASPAGVVPFDPITALLALDGQVGPGESSPVVQLVAGESSPGALWGTVAAAREHVPRLIAALTGAGFTVLEHAAGAVHAPS